MSEESSTPSPRHSSPAEAMQQASSPSGYFGDVVFLAEATSTNELLSTAARDGAAEGMVLVADTQSAGRGRMARRWHSPPEGALLCSILFRPSLAVAELFHLSSIVALAASRATTATTGLRIALKWPNDLLAKRGKLAGVLAEIVETSPPVVVVGIGYNLFWPPGWPPRGATEAAEQLAGATTLEEVSGQRIERDDFLGVFLEELDLLYSQLLGADGPRAIAKAYRRECSTIGSRVRVDTPTGRIFGVAVDVRVDGSLEVDVGGMVRLVSVADVVHLRSDDAST